MELQQHVAGVGAVGDEVEAAARGHGPEHGGVVGKVTQRHVPRPEEPVFERRRVRDELAREAPGRAVSRDADGVERPLQQHVVRLEHLARPELLEEFARDVVLQAVANGLRCLEEHEGYDRAS